MIRPVAYNPFKEEEAADWDLFDDCDCPSLENAAVAETDDVTACKKACEKGQLKGKGIGAFVQRGGKTVFKQCTHAEAIAAKSPAKGAKMFIIGDPEASANLRLMQAVEGEGLPRLKSPFEHGNLFLILNIEFPTTLPPPPPRSSSRCCRRRSTCPPSRRTRTTSRSSRSRRSTRSSRTRSTSPRSPSPTTTTTTTALAASASSAHSSRGAAPCFFVSGAAERERASGMGQGSWSGVYGRADGE